MTNSHRKPGTVWQLERANLANGWLNKRLKCIGCEKTFKVGEWVVQATVTPRRKYHGAENGYARVRHLECFIDAKGRPMFEKPE